MGETATATPPLSHETLAQVYRETVRDWMEQDGFETLDELVEQGYCADLATVVWEHFGRAGALVFRDCEAPCHTWLEFEGRHYDMEDPDGADSIEQMRYFQGTTPRGVA